jgi:thiamine biosynthesis protein ThiS
MSPIEKQTAAVRVEVNGERRAVAAPCTIADLIDLLGLGGKRVAVALNRDVIVRSRYDQTPVAEGDRIEILEAVGGG